MQLSYYRKIASRSIPEMDLNQSMPSSKDPWPEPNSPLQEWTFFEKLERRRPGMLKINKHVIA
jgi:hypothetical protein